MEKRKFFLFSSFLFFFTRTLGRADKNGWQKQDRAKEESGVHACCVL